MWAVVGLHTICGGCLEPGGGTDPLVVLVLVGMFVGGWGSRYHRRNEEMVPTCFKLERTLISEDGMKTTTSCCDCFQHKLV